MKVLIGTFLIIVCISAVSVSSQPTPMFYGWFFNEIIANGLNKITNNYLESLYKTVGEVEVFLKNVSSMAKIQNPLEYYTKPLDPNTGNYDKFYHITTFYCGNEDCSSYSSRVNKYLGENFTTHLVGVFFTPRTYGIRVNLTSIQKEIFEMNEINVNVESQFSTYNDDPCTYQSEDDIEFCPQDVNFQPTDTRAHVTLGCAPNISAVTTGLDLLDIIKWEKEPLRFCFESETDRGHLIQMGDNCDAFVYYLKEKMVTNATFNVYYNDASKTSGMFTMWTTFVSLLKLVFF